ncbi:alpha-ketoacid dehydrogenase subunit alpha/beta [Occallatibacter savannae]|uniref:alpha-ketoacid dehydrogenase subunit alpha/beta n=1 Tax=Occallatibacter savannae TaxID=1002691 RepID=UPI000D68B90F|nr:dehydrogenase E1 component subunit alpha/beta [Occallatibacter savannae]
MGLAVSSAHAPVGIDASGRLSSQELIQIYRLMYLSRRIDDREILLKRQQKTFFQISAAGHEAFQVAAGLALRPGYDWFFPYYRDRGLTLTLGVSPTDMFLQAVGAGSDPASGGRQMPTHWSSRELNIVSTSSSTATQILHAVGCAEAGQYFTRHPEAAARVEGDYRAYRDVTFHGDEVVLACIGEGSTSQGEFWEALNTASNRKLPVIFMVEDNGYAISVPVEVNTPGGNISRLVANFPNFHFEEVDGTDPEQSLRAFQRAAEHCRAGLGPAFVHGHCIRVYSHSLSDDDKLYRSAAEREADALRDPIHKMHVRLLSENVLTTEQINALEKELEREAAEAAERALEAPLPEIAGIEKHVYSEDLDPRRAEFATETAQAAGAKNGKSASGKGAAPKTMADLINACLHDEMARDPRIVVYGEDVADASREEALSEVKGKGGVFKLTSGLQTEFGSERVYNSPLAEANIVGRAVGLAVRGMKPVVEIQFFDYIWPAVHQIHNELALMRWRSNGAWAAPAVIRVPIGGYLTGGAIYHSQSGESIFTHIPGLRVAFPSNALDANGLLRTAIRCDDPVLFLEHKRLYRESYGRAPYPGPDFAIPFGKAKIVRPGEHMTLVTYGALVPRALQAAEKASREKGIEVEVIDLRTLSPYDWEAIATSVRKTSRVIVAHEDMLSWGYGAEIAARIADELFDDLDAPVKRIGAMDTFVAYQPVLEDVILPQPDTVLKAIVELHGY